MGTRAAVVVLGVLTVTGWGVAAGLGGALLVLQDEADPDPVAVGADLPTTVPDVVGGDPAPPGQPAVDTYELTVHTDGCGVVRSEGPGGQDLDGLTWTFLDADGFQVLGRNALGETRYRYFSAGTFEVVLEAWGDGSYVPVSNTVTITC